MSNKRVKIPGRLESAETGNIVAGADAIKDDVRGKTQYVVNNEMEAAILQLGESKQNKLTFDQTPTEDSTNPVTSGGVYAADQLLSQAIEAILLLIPSAASALNKLVDMQTMNSSIATATASFKGTYNLVSDLHLGVDATHAQIAAALDALSLDADNNDYAFVQIPNTDTAPTEIKKTERYKFNGENWAYEYDLNNSGFTSAQWNAINSGITTLLVLKLLALPTNEALVAALEGKQDNLTFDNVPTAGSPNPVKSGGIYTRNNEIVALINALDAAKQDVLTFDTTPTSGSHNPVTSNGIYLAIQLVQTAVEALDGRMSTAETKISTAETNIVNLQAAYAALTQSDIVVVEGALPSSGQQQNVIYRQPDPDHTPPQFYSDYMWNGTAWVLMATYNNAIDDEPTAGSNNLVKSGGVYEEINQLGQKLVKSIYDFAPYSIINPHNYMLNNEGSIILPNIDYYCVELAPDKIYKINAYNMVASPDLPLYLFFDANDEIVLVKELGTETHVGDIIIAPTGVAKIVLNYQTIELLEGDIMEDIPQQIKERAYSSVQELIGTSGLYIPVSKVLVESGKGIDSTGQIFTSADYSIYKCGIKKGDVVKITAKRSIYVSVFAREHNGDTEVLIPGENGAYDIEYKYNSDFSGELFFNVVTSDSDTVYILTSSRIEGGLSLNPVYKKKVLCLGDSITALKDSCGMGWPDYFQEMTNSIIVNGAIGGTRLSARKEMVETPTSLEDAYAALDLPNLIDAIISGNYTRQEAAATYLQGQGQDQDITQTLTLLKNTPITSYDYIIVLSGTNDWGAQTYGQDVTLNTDSRYNINSAIKYIAETISENIPHALLLAFTPLVRYVGDERDQQYWSDNYKERGITLGEFCKRMMSSWRKSHIPVGDLYYSMGWNQQNFSLYFNDDDNVHPFNGFSLLAEKIKGFVFNSGMVDNILVDTFNQNDAILSYLNLSGGFEYPVTELYEDNKFITADGSIAESTAYQIRKVSISNGDLAKLVQFSSQYRAQFAKMENGVFIVLKSGEEGFTTCTYISTFDGDLYFVHYKGCDDIAIVRSLN